MSADLPIVFRWSASSYFGWGIYGLNLMLHWPQPALTEQPLERIVVVREDQRRRIAELTKASERLHEQLAAYAGRKVIAQTPVFIAYGNDLQCACSGIHGVDLFGTPTIGFGVLEQAAISRANVDAVNQLAQMVAGSSWNAAVLAEAGVKRIVTVLQGVDCELFRPRPKSGRFAGRFVVFSGGQTSLRKGQDLVMLAFRAFAERHPDALLMTVWHSPWPYLAQTFTGNSELSAPPLRSDGALDVALWASRAGIGEHQFLDIGTRPNSELAAILADADVALFPNRAEGGTNLIAMECLASGVPTILSANTGHLDLIERTQTFAAMRQRPVTAVGFRSTAGWGESDIEELVELLEAIYNRPEDARSRAERAARAMLELSWERQIRELHRVLEPLL
jgi:glycosyltransferase involved in cell wall biosynthesis